jgi:hypothetical protein
MVPKTKKHVSALVSAIYMAIVLATGLSSGPALALPAPGPGIPLWAPDWMANASASPNYDPGLSRAIKEAKTFDLIVAHPTEFDRYVPQMMRANPSLRLFGYVNGMFSPDTTYGEGAYSHNANGRRIKSKVFGTYLMDPSSGVWRRAVLRMCVQARNTSGYQGCFLDALGLMGTNPSSVTARPVDPRTGVLYKRRAWLSETEGLAAFVRGSLAPSPVLGNGITDGADYFDPTGPTSMLLDGLTGGMDEAWVRQATDPVNSYRSVNAWRDDVDMLSNIATRKSGNVAIVVCKLWVKATAGQIASWHKYSLATFMLGYKPGHAYYSFRSDHNLTDPYSMTSVNIGTPTGAYFANSAAFQRRFTKGTVVVNPSDTSVKVSLGGAYLNAAGRVIRTLTLGPHGAAILDKA